MSTPLNWTGTWSGTTNYNVGDAASYLGSSYVAAVANTDVTPNNNPGIWNLLAAAGSVGPQGSAGLNGSSGSGVPQGLNWRGAYSTLAAYNAYDCVSFNNSSYICTANGVLNKEPDSNPSYWGVLCVGGSSSSGTGLNISWGGIAGTLSNQTDIESALNAKANTASLATVATSGSYNDLANKPTIPAAQVSSDWNSVVSPTQILNKPTLAASATTDTTNAANITTGTLAAARIPTLNQNTTGTAAGLSANIAESQVTNLTTDLASKVGTSTLAALATGLVKVTTGTGVLSIAAAADIPQLAYTSLSGLPTIPAASSTTPVVDGTATIGSLTTYAKADHIHPTDTSRAATSAIPVASSTTPAMDGTAAVGVGTTWARADHVHGSDTSRVSTATTVNGHALSTNVVVSASDLTTGTLPHAQLPALVSGDIPANAANTSGNAATATNVAYTGLTGTVPTWNQSTTGTAANITATTNATLTTLSALALPQAQVTGLATSLAALAPAASPTLTGTVTLPATYVANGVTLNQPTTAGTLALTSQITGGSGTGGLVFSGVNVVSATYTTTLADLSNLIVSKASIVVTLTTTGLVAGNAYCIMCDTTSGTTVKAQTGTINGSSSVTLSYNSTSTPTWGHFVFDGTNFYALLTIA